MRAWVRIGLLATVVAGVVAPAAIGVSGSDTITTIAGTGTPGFAGDGGQATSAQLYYPDGTAFDAQGNVYIADSNNNRVRKVSNGNITTFAGTGTAGSAGDGGQATSAQLYTPVDVAIDSQGNLYIADQDNNRIRKVSRRGSSRRSPARARRGTQATGARRHRPKSTFPRASPSTRRETSTSPTRTNDRSAR